MMRPAKVWPPSPSWVPTSQTSHTIVTHRADFAVANALLDCAGDDVADGRVPALVLDALHLLGPAVVAHNQAGAVDNHVGGLDPGPACYLVIEG